MRLSDVDVIVFDLDNTLMNRQAALTRWFVSIVECYRPEWDTIRQRRVMADLLQLDHWGDTDRQNVMQRLAGQLNHCNADAPTLMKRFQQELAGHVKPDQRANTLLNWLRDQPVLLFLASNGSSSNQRAKFAACGADSAAEWQSVVISAEVGFAKPDPHFFEHLRSLINGDTHRVLMVGDDWNRDVQAAAHLGWQTCWVSHDRPSPSTGVQPDVVVRHVAELWCREQRNWLHRYDRETVL